MTFIPNPGVRIDGKLAAPKAATRKNLAVDMKVGRKNVFDYSDSAVSDGSTDARAAVLAADTDGPSLLPPGTYALASNTTLSKKPKLEPGAKFKPASGVVLTLSDGFEASDFQHIFDLSAGGTVVVANQPHITLCHFGATVDTANIKTYFDAAVNVAVASQIPLIIPPGTYTATETITITSKTGLTVAGMSRRVSTIHFTDGGFDLVEDIKVNITALTISGDGQEKDGILARVGSKNISVTNCHISGFTSPGDPSTIKGQIYFQDVTDGAEVSGCTFDGVGADTAGDIVLVNCQDIRVTNNGCLTANGDGVSIANTVSGRDIRGVVSNNVIRDKNRHGMLIGYGSQNADLSVSTNAIYNCKNNGIYYNPGNEPAAFASGRVSIVGNEVSYCGGESGGDGAGNSGIHIGGHLGGACTGNTIFRAGYRPDVAFTTTSGNNLTSTAHGLTVGQKMLLTGSSLPTPLVEGNYYVATVVDANNFTVAATAITTPITLTSTGSGNYAAVRGTGRGRGILLVGGSNWTVTGNTITRSAAPAFETNAAFLANNILFHSNLLIDNGGELNGAQIVLSNANQTADMDFSFANNTIHCKTVDCHGILVFSGSTSTAPTSLGFTASNNTFIGMRAGTGKAAVSWNNERYAQTSLTNNKFINWDAGVNSKNNTSSTSEDWVFGSTVHMEHNTYDKVTTPFDLRTDVYSAVGKYNTFVDCEPNFGQKIVPASITNGILDGYYVADLPARRCRKGDRLEPLYPETDGKTKWLNVAAAPGTVAFTVSSGNNLTATSHGLTQYQIIRLSGGSLPTPLTAGDYYVATVVDANNFTVNKVVIPIAMNLTSTGSGDYQALQATPTFEAFYQGSSSASTANLESQAATINTTDKYEGKCVFNVDTNKPVYALGSTANAQWVDATGTSVHTPV